MRQWRTLLDALGEVWVIVGDEDPRADAGVDAGTGSLYLRRDRSAGASLFTKFGVLPREWRPQGSDGSINVLDYGATGDGTTDDTAAIRRAVSSSGGKICLFPPGIYRVDPTESIEVPPGAVLDGSSGLARIQLNAPTRLPRDAYVFAVRRGSDRVTIRGLHLAGTGPSLGERIRGIGAYEALALVLDSVRVSSLTGAGILVSNCPGAQLRDIDVSDCGRTSNAATCEEGIAVLSDQLQSDHPYFAADCRLVGGRVRGSGLDGLIWTAPHGQITGLVAEDNGVDKAQPREGAAGIWFGTPADRLRISKCRCARNSGNGIDTSPNPSPVRGVEIAANLCHDNGSAGIQVDDVVDIVVRDNQCFANGRTGLNNQWGGIVVASHGSVSRCWVHHNRSHDDGAVPVQRYGLQIGASDRSRPRDLIVEDNDFDSNARAGIGTEWATASFVAEGFGSFRRNRGYVPLVTTLPDGQLPAIADVIRLRPDRDSWLREISMARAGDTIAVIFENALTTVVGGPDTLRLRSDRSIRPAAKTQMMFHCDGRIWRELGGPSGA